MWLLLTLVLYCSVYIDRHIGVDLSDDEQYVRNMPCYIVLYYSSVQFQSWTKGFQQSDWSRGFLYEPLQAVYITFSSPGYWARHLCHLGKETWQTVGNEFFVYLEDITANPGCMKGWKIIKMTAVDLGPKTFQELAVVSWSPAGQIDWPKSASPR